MENLDPFGGTPELPPGPFDDLELEPKTADMSDNESDGESSDCGVVIVSKKKTIFEKIGAAMILFLVLIVYSYLIFSQPGTELIKRFRFVDNKPEYVPLIQSASVSAVGLAVSLFLSFG